MSEVTPRYKLVIDPLVAGDLTRVKQQDVYALAKIIALLQEYVAGTFSPEELIDEHFESDEIESVQPFWALQGERLNAYRLKLVAVRAWRILTAGDRKRREVAVLAIMHRDQDYQSDRELMTRLRRSYENLDFKRLGE